MAKSMAGKSGKAAPKLGSTAGKSTSGGMKTLFTGRVSMGKGR
jgi:hypothetical protein